MDDKQRRRLQSAHSKLSKWISESDREGPMYQAIVDMRNHLGTMIIRDAVYSQEES